MIVTVGLLDPLPRSHNPVQDDPEIFALARVNIFVLWSNHRHRGLFKRGVLGTWLNGETWFVVE